MIGITDISTTLRLPAIIIVHIAMNTICIHQRTVNSMVYLLTTKHYYHPQQQDIGQTIN